MCTHQHHTRVAEIATLDRPASGQTKPAPLPTAPKSNSVLPSSRETHTRPTQVASLEGQGLPERRKSALPPILPTKPKSPPTSAPAKSAPTNATAQSKPVQPASAPVKPAVLPPAAAAMIAQVNSVLTAAFEQRKTLISAPGGISNNGEKRWQASLLEEIFKAVFPDLRTRPDMFEGSKKSQTMSGILAKLKEFEFDKKLLPLFMGGERRS